MAANAATVSSTSASAHAEVLIGRQPIFNADLQVHAYELLYRSVGPDRAVAEDADASSAEVITAGFMDIGLSSLVENKMAYLNVSHEFLSSREPMALPVARSLTTNSWNCSMNTVPKAIV